MIEVKVDTAALSKLIDDLAEGFDDEVVGAMAQEILGGASKRVPVDTGKLQVSGHVEERPGATAAVVYGGKKAPYAAAVHELHPGPGKAFLRDAVMDKRRLMGAVVKVAKRIIERAETRLIGHRPARRPQGSRRLKAAAAMSDRSMQSLGVEAAELLIERYGTR